MIISILFNLLVGFVMGVILGWNKKVYFVGMMVIVVLWLAVASYVGISTLESEVVWWEFIINVFFIVVGINAGRASYEGAFK